MIILWHAPDGREVLAEHYARCHVRCFSRAHYLTDYSLRFHLMTGASATATELGSSWGRPYRANVKSVATLSRRRKLNEKNVAAVPATKGVYVLYGTHGSPAYVGRGMLRARLTDQLTTGRVPAAAFAYAETRKDAEASKLERELIQRLLPRFNVHSAA